MDKLNCTVKIQSPKLGVHKAVPVYQDTWLLYGENVAYHFNVQEFNFVLQKLIKGELDGVYS